MVTLNTEVLLPSWSHRVLLRSSSYQRAIACSLQTNCLSALKEDTTSIVTSTTTCIQKALNYLLMVIILYFSPLGDKN